MKEAVKKYIAEHYEDYVKDLEALTNIDSGNGDREGTEAANKFVAEKMTAIGATTEFRYNDRACHLISRLKGTGKYTILLVAHVDTVFKKGEAARRPFRVDENNFAWGPGVGDDKATVVEVIYGLEALKAAGFDNFKEIIYYTNGEEEGGSKTAEDIVAELSQQSDFAIIMTLHVRTGALLPSARAMPNIALRLPVRADTTATHLNPALTLFTSWLIQLPSCRSLPAPCRGIRRIIRQQR